MQFDLQLPELFNASDYFVDRHIREGRGGKIAVKCQDRSFTYADIQAGMNQVGNALKSLNVRMEERVALLLLDTEIYPQAFFGAVKIGAVPICLNTLMRPKDYLYFLNDSRARVLLVDAALYANIEEIKAETQFLEHIVVVNGAAPAGTTAFADFIAGKSKELEAAPTTPDDSCFWLYSSGSTGKPKGTIHLQHDMVYACETYGKQVLGIREDDVCFSAAKLFFAYGLGNGLYFPFSVGATTVYMPDRPVPASVYETIRKFKPTLYFGVPTLYGSMLQEEGSMDGVRLCVSAGEALPADILKRWVERHGVQIADGIGSTELVHIFISNRPDEIKPGSSGKIVPGYEARIVDEDWRDVAEGDVGTLLIKGDSAAAGYWNKHEKTKTTMLGEWLNTDDQYYRDKDGFFYYVGRSNDMLKVGGIWVSPIEVEACLIEHPAVLECAVVGSPDSENLIKPKAFVVLDHGYTGDEKLEKELKEYVKTKLAHYKFPRWIVFLNELPKTATGKIKRFELRKGDFA
ncbi:benzoate-CoA ligase family protein [Desulforhabdus sp. TSK]|uniref:benzoate-CoA ligase family protein n=1 Tax=Desulforhabdus sp. TSK TaxID=2925014 RepID=UPI001FC85007|nr:benzoate-CoA ligase family protein [Desulforhabdus sp. TSK]GKT08515.1 acetyl-CoA synthetase [Desulforhabdus sp. TSK]